MTAPDPTALAHPSRRAQRWNLALSLVLLALVALLGNAAAARHLNVRRDFSEDGLHTISSATRTIVGRLEDRVTVRLFATEEIEDGPLALQSSRVRSQLEEFMTLRPAVFEQQVLDPSRSSEAARRATESGFRPLRAGRSGMGAGGGEPVWLALELSYRGRIERIPAPTPWRFEVQFASALHALQKDRKVGIGWLGAPIEPPISDEREREVSESESTFRLLRAALEQRARLVPLVGLERGKPVPDEVDVLFVVRPPALHARTVYEIDQFVQRGGRMIVCLDDPDYNLLTTQARYGADDFEASSFAGMLRSWGIRVAPAKQVWDGDWSTTRVGIVAGPGGETQAVQLRSPLAITVREEGLATSLPPVQGLDAVLFGWAHPVVPVELAPLPAGVERIDLVTSSESAWVDEMLDRLPTNASTLRTRLQVLRRSQGRRHVLGAVFGGRFPSPWKDRAAPDPEEVLGIAPELEPRDTLSSAASTQVVVFGDADWVRDPWPTRERPFFAGAEGGGLTLALNLVDWLTLDEELIGLRSRAPSLRPLRDFVAEEAKALGVYERDPYETESERKERDRNADLARQRARRKQWWTMLAPAGLALLVVLGAGALANWRSNRVARRAELERTGGAG